MFLQKFWVSLDSVNGVVLGTQKQCVPVCVCMFAENTSLIAPLKIIKVKKQISANRREIKCP